MNRRTPGLTLAKAVPGFLLYKTVQALSPNTLHSYQDHVKLWLKYAGEVVVERITSADLCAFLVWLRQEYQPQRITGNTAPLAAKTLRNYWVSLSAFFTWAARELGIPNPMLGVPAPKFAAALVQPFTRDEIEQLLKAAEFCNRANTTRRRRFVMRRPTAQRDRALIPSTTLKVAVYRCKSDTPQLNHPFECQRCEGARAYFNVLSLEVLRGSAGLTARSRVLICAHHYPQGG